MKRSHVLIWFLFLTLFAAPSFAQQDADLNATMTLHVSTRLVLPDASVLNKKTGQRIGNLTLDDLSLSETICRRSSRTSVQITCRSLSSSSST